MFKAIKERVQIVDIVSEYVALKHTGAYAKGLCPLHQEKTPSFVVTPDKGIFYCFSCKEGGDVIAFVARMERCTHKEAALLLVDRYKIALPAYQAQEGDENFSATQRHFVLCQLIADWCVAQLNNAPRAQEYLKKRCIQQEIQERFQIGYMPAGERARKLLISSLEKKGFLLHDLLALKFFIASRGSYYSPFEERIMFPIHDHMGRACGFGGRIYLPEDERPKYYNSHDHIHFSKGSLLFGFHHAKRAAQKEAMLYLVEGYLDCIALVQAGRINTVATLGTACTGEHLKLAKRHISKIGIMYDGDQAGRNATLKLGEVCWEEGIDLLIIRLPAQEDPAAYLAAGGHLSSLKEQDVCSWYIESIQSQLAADAPLSEKLAALRELMRYIARVPDLLAQEILLQRTAQASSLSLMSLQRELTHYKQSSQNSTLLERSSQESSPRKIVDRDVGRSSQDGIPARPATVQTKFSDSLFCAIIQDACRLTESDHVMITSLLREPLRTIFIRFQAYKRECAGATFSDFFNQLEAQYKEEVNHLLLQRSLYDEQGQEVGQLQELLKRCHVRYWKQLVQTLKERIAHAQQSNDHDRLQDLLEKFQKLKQSLHDKGIL